jgi:hypothetical protein
VPGVAEREHATRRVTSRAMLLPTSAHDALGRTRDRRARARRVPAHPNGAISARGAAHILGAGTHLLGTPAQRWLALCGVIPGAGAIS